MYKFFYVSSMRSLMSTLLGMSRGESRIASNPAPPADPDSFTVWCYSPQTQHEWSVTLPYSAFLSLRADLVALRPSIEQMTFPPPPSPNPPPQSSGGLFSTFSRPPPVADRAQALDRWLRKLARLVYASALHEKSREVLLLLIIFLKPLESRVEFPPIDPGCLPAALETYACRVLVLPVLDLLISQFVAALAASLPNNPQLVDYVKRQERGALKEIADEHMGKLAGFADQLSAMVVEGCKADMEALAGRAEFEGRGWNGEEEVQRAVQRVVEMEV